MMKTVAERVLTKLSSGVDRSFLVLGVALFGLFCSAAVFAQSEDTPVSVTLVPFLVSEVTLDDGTIEERFSEADVARPGQVIEYRLLVENQSEEMLPAGSVVVTGPVPDVTTYLGDSAVRGPEMVQLEFSIDAGASFSETPMIEEDGENVAATPDMYNAVRWTLLDALSPEESLTFSYRVTVN